MVERERFPVRARHPAAGFTLIEALIATVLGALVIGLAVSVVVAQGGYFRDVHARASVQESVRSTADLLREELQTVIRGGIITAESDRLVVRAPLAMGIVCGDVKGPPGKGKGKGVGMGKGKGKGTLSTAPVYLPLPGGGVDKDRVSWYAIREEGSEWVYREGTWADLLGAGGNPAGECQAVGTDVTGAGASFHRMTGFQSPAIPSEGDLIALFTEVEFRFDPSALEPGTGALFRQEGTGDAVEFATGLTAASRFRYRRQGQTTFQDNVSGAQLDEIVEIRIRTLAESQDPRGGAGPLTYDWDLRIPLRNAP
jgi:type II secretory pathway pseudopilin PulG